MITGCLTVFIIITIIFFCEIKHCTKFLRMPILIVFFDDTFLGCKMEKDLERIKFDIPLCKEQDN